MTTFPATPIFDRMTADWNPLTQVHPDLFEEDANVRKANSVAYPPTPLMDDVKAHGVGPWDEHRRSYLGKFLPAKPVAPRPRARRPKAVKGAS